MSNEQTYIERYWRDATPADAIKEPPMVARFRNGKEYAWDRGHLRGIRCGRIHPWYCQKLGSYSQCQVYDAPDPGDGWRLIDTENECPQEGDEFREDWQVNWQSRGEFSDTYFAPKTHYRRRIEQPKPKYEAFRWEDREQLRGRWIGSNDGRWERFVAFIYNYSESFYANGISTESLLKEWYFLDTGEPVGRRVE